MMSNDQWPQLDHPHDEKAAALTGWTLWREIYGTFIGVAAIAIPLAFAAVKYINALDMRITRIEVQIVAGEKEDAARESYRQERNTDREGRLKRIEAVSDRIELRLNELIARKK